MPSRAARFRMAVVLLLFGAHAVAGIHTAEAAHVTYVGTPVSGWSVNGQVRAVLTIGSRVIVGGTFSQAVSPLGTRVPRANVAAFDVRTGDLDPSFQVSTDAMVRALATDGTHLFLGGNFTVVNGQPRGRVAAVDVFSGVLVPGFAPSANADVYDVEVVGNRLAVAGSFTTLGGAPTPRLALASIATGAVDRTFVPSPDNTVRALQLSPDGTVLYAGGRHTTIGGVNAPKLAAIDLATRTPRRLTFATLVDEVIDLAVSGDGAQVYAGVGGLSNQVIAWNARTGAHVWHQRADGDVQAVEYSAGNVWYAFHEGAGGDTSVRLLGADALTGASLPFRPAIDSFFGVWDIDATRTNLTIGGEFRTVAGVASRGVATFLDGSQSRRVPLVAARSTWRFRADGTDLGTTWRAPTFDDRAWAAGAGPLGYGDNDEATVIRPPSDPPRPLTSYFRTSFVVDDVSALSGFVLDLVRDDGAVVYLNNVEIARSNMPAGPVTAATRASSSAQPENAYVRIPLSAAPLVAGTNVLAVEVHQESPTSGDVSFDLQFAALRAAAPQPTPVTYLPPRSTWRYLDNGSDQGTTWREPAFDATTWRAGAGQLGYGEGDEATVVSSGPGNTRAITTYFRSTFTVTDPARVRDLTLQLLRDDGAVVYINGVEVLRSNMPTGPITFTTRAAAVSSPENTYQAQIIPSTALIAGINVIAVEVHQESPGSSDVSFDLALSALLAPQ